MERAGLKVDRVIAWGFPLFSPLYRNLLEALGALAALGQRPLSEVLGHVAISLAVVVFAAMTALIVDRDNLTNWDKILVTVSLGLAWTFANTVYAMHYAHLYYAVDTRGRDCGGKFSSVDLGLEHGGIEIAPPRAQAAEVKRPAFARSDDVGSGARTLRFRKLDFVGHPERGGDAGERGLRLRGRAGTKVAAGDGDAQAFAAARE